MWSLLAAPCSPHDCEVVSVSGRRFGNRGPVDASYRGRVGDILMVFLNGYHYIGVVAEVHAGEVRFMGQDRWLRTDGMYALRRPG